MKRIDTKLPGVCIVEPDVHGDQRGYFMETYNQKAFADIGITATFVQDNQSFTATKGVLRGIHFQNAPHAQAKLVRVTRGAVMDVAVDLRKGSPTYRQWVAVELSAENKRMLFIPRGFGHGFKTLTDDVEFCYKVDDLYSRECDRGIRFNDPAIGVDWGEVTESLLSQKDTTSPLLADSDCNFVYSTADLSTSDLPVISIYGSEDGVLNMEKYAEYRRNLPAALGEHIIEGGCHAGFGSYGPQDGDGVPTITGEEQIAETVRLLTAFFDSAQK